MRYKEYAPPRAWSVWVFLIYALLLLPLCWLPQLSTDEASVAQIAGEMHELGDFFTFRLFGRQEFVLPFLPWTLALLGQIMPINEFSIRLLSIVPTGLLAFLCYWVVRRITGLKTGPIAAAVVISTVIVLQKGVVGDGFMLYSLFINLAWFLFYYFGRIKRKWLLAWFLSHLFVCAAMLTVGMKAAILFYVPLLFLRRPMNIRLRLLKSEHILSASLILVLLGGLLAMIPDLRNNLSEFFTTFAAVDYRGSYFFRLIAFPVMAIAGTFPWVFLAWPAFCQAYRSLESPMVFANFNRTIVSSIFVLFWLVPSQGPSELLPLIGPFAVLVAINYDVLVRRHGPELVRYVQLMAITALIISAAWLAGGYFQGREGLLVLAKLNPEASQAASFMVCCAVVIAGILIKWTPRFPIWLLVLFAALMLKLLYTGTYQANHFRKDNRRRELAKKLAGAVPENVTLYEVLPSSEKLNFSSEWYYLGHDVIKLLPGQKLPSEKEVYVIGGKNEPTIESETLLPTEETVPREWVPLTREVPYRHKSDRTVFTIWKGVKNEQAFTWRASDLLPDEGIITYSKKVDEWGSLRGGSLVQPDGRKQPRWLRFGLFRKRIPALRFEGGQYLQRNASGLIKHLELEHTFVLVVRLLSGTEPQVLLDIRGKGPENTAILQRITYDPSTQLVTGLSRDGEGNQVRLVKKADLRKPSVVILRRNKDTLELLVNARADDPSAAGVQPEGMAASELSSQLNTLKEIESGQMHLYLGAGQNDEDEIEQNMYGLLAEFRIINRWLDDQRIHTLTELLLKTYFER